MIGKWKKKKKSFHQCSALKHCSEPLTLSLFVPLESCRLKDGFRPWRCSSWGSTWFTRCSRGIYLIQDATGPQGYHLWKWRTPEDGGKPSAHFRGCETWTICSFILNFFQCQLIANYVMAPGLRAKHSARKKHDTLLSAWVTGRAAYPPQLVVRPTAD